MVINTTDGRVFINMTTISGNYGDGVHYREAYDQSWYLEMFGKYLVVL